MHIVLKFMIGWLIVSGGLLLRCQYLIHQHSVWYIKLGQKNKRFSKKALNKLQIFGKCKNLCISKSFIHDAGQWGDSYQIYFCYPATRMQLFSIFLVTVRNVHYRGCFTLLNSTTASFPVSSFQPNLTTQSCIETCTDKVWISSLKLQTWWSVCCSVTLMWISRTPRISIIYGVKCH